jgi:hypothetical protein
MKVRTWAVVALVVTAWAVGRAQSRDADFVIAFEAYSGARITCQRGCKIVGNRDLGVRPPEAEYTYSCGSNPAPCRATIHGFLQR